MYALIEYVDSGRGRPAAEIVKICRTDFLWMKIPGNSRGRRRKKQILDAERTLRQLGARKIIVGNRAEGRDEFRSFPEIRAEEIFSAAAAAISRTLLQKDGESALVCTDRLTGQAEKILLHMAQSRRKLFVISCGGRGGAWDALRRKTGISVVWQPGTEQLQHVDTAVFLSPPPCPLSLPVTCTALCAEQNYAANGCKTVAGVAYELPPDCTWSGPFSRDAITAAAIQSGALQEEDVHVNSILTVW